MNKTEETKKQSWCVLLAGPNGAGKTTFYEQILQNDPMFKSATFINSDLIGKDLATLSNQGDSNSHIIHAGRIAINLINKKIRNGDSFIYETTSSGKSHLERLQEAKANGFKIITIFIGLSSLDLAKARVSQRVAKGGHDIEEDIQQRRYGKIIETFPDMLKVSDISAVFDNSGNGSKHDKRSSSFNLIFLMDESKNFIFNNYPNWLQTSLENRKTQKTEIPMYESITGEKKKKTAKIWVSKEKFKQLPPERSTQLIRTIFDNFKASSDR